MTKFLKPALAGAVLAVLTAPAWAIDLTNADGSWTFSFGGEVNVDYIYTSCQSQSSKAIVAGGLTCVGDAGGNGQSSVSQGLLPAAFTFGVKTTQNGVDLAAHLGLYPGVATNDGGSPNLQATATNLTNTALGTTGLDIRQVYLTAGNKDMGTFTAGRNFGLFGFDVIINDMTLLGIGAPGGAATPFPANTTLGGIGFGYIYTDTLAQIDYTTPDFSGFNATVGIFNPINSLSDPGTVDKKKAPGFHAKVTYTVPINDATKLYLSAAFLSQKQNFETGGTGITGAGPATFSYTGDGIDIFAKLDWQAFELIGYYYHADGLGTTAFFLLGDDGMGNTRTSDGYFAQATYKFGPVKLGVNYGESKLDFANAADQAANPFLVDNNRKVTGGIYYSLTKNLTLLGEYSNVQSKAHTANPVNGQDSNTSNTVNVGLFLGF